MDARPLPSRHRQPRAAKPSALNRIAVLAVALAALAFATREILAILWGLGYLRP